MPTGANIHCSLHKFEQPTDFTSAFASQHNATTLHNVCIGNPLSQPPNTTLQHAICFETRFAFCQPAASIQFALGLTSFTPAHPCTLWRAVQSRTASFTHEGRFFLFHLLHQVASLTIIVACFLVGCLSALQHPKPPDFCCAFQGTSEPIGSTPAELALPGESQTKGLGPSGSETKCVSLRVDLRSKRQEFLDVQCWVGIIIVHSLYIMVVNGGLSQCCFNGPTSRNVAGIYIGCLMCIVIFSFGDCCRLPSSRSWACRTVWRGHNIWFRSQRVPTLWFGSPQDVQALQEWSQ